MVETEAGRAAELVVGVDLEVAGLAPVAPLALHVVLAQALAVVGVAGRAGREELQNIHKL